jgi:hypothetical protein
MADRSSPPHNADTDPDEQPITRNPAVPSPGEARTGYLYRQSTKPDWYAITTIWARSRALSLIIALLT